MKIVIRMCLLLLLVFGAFILRAGTNDSIGKFEINFFSGYRSPLGYFGFKFGYNPEMINGRININIGIGSARLQGRVSCGSNFTIVKVKSSSTYVGFDFMIGLKSYIVTRDGLEWYEIGFNKYLSPHIGIKIGNQLWLRFEIGYSFLLNNPGIRSTVGPSTQYNDLIKYIESGPCITIGFGGTISLDKFRERKKGSA